MSCINCGERDLSDITQHSCSKCALIYRYCPACIVNSELMLDDIWKDGIDHEFDD